MKLQKFTAAFLALILFSIQSFAQINFQSSNSAANVGGQPQYQIFNIGVVQTGDSASQGFGVSPGGIGLGRSNRTGGSQAFSWTQAGGIVGLPNLTARNFCVSNGANDSGAVVGTCSTTIFGSGKLPTIWQNGAVAQLPLPGSETLGDANDVNASGVAVGSVGGGSGQRGAIYSNGTASVITQTTANGSFFSTAFRINDSGRVVGAGVDPNNAARTVGIVYDIGSNSAFEVGALPNANGAIAFDVSNTGLVVGTSTQNQSSPRPFIWSQAGGITEIPLPAGTTQGSARGVNSNGWAVGTASSQFAVPFLYDGTSTYRLGDLIPANSGWDLLNNTTAAALGISDSGIIVGTGVLNGQVRAFAMIPATNAPDNTAFDFDGDGKTDIGIFRPADGSWWYQRSSSTDFRVYSFGTASDIMTPGDFTGDGKTDISVFRPSNGEWYIQRSEDGSYFSFPFGAAGDIPVPADYDADGKTDAAIWRPSTGTWYILNSGGSGTAIVNFGVSGDKPVSADYDGDGKADIAIFRPSDGSWWYLRSSDSQFRVYTFGVGTDIPVQGDYSGDGKAELAVFRPGTGEWFFQRSEDNSYYSVPFGSGTDIPAPGDYDGDGKFDTAVFRPSNGEWHVQRSTAGTLITGFGAQGDRPIPNAYVR